MGEEARDDVAVYGVKWTTPGAPSALPLKGAPLADRQSRIRGGRLIRCHERVPKQGPDAIRGTHHRNVLNVIE